MTVYLKQDSLAQPLQPEGQHSGRVTDQPPSLEEMPESEGEVFPTDAGDDIASIDETVEAISESFLKDKNLSTKLSTYAERKIKEIMGSKNNGKFTGEDYLQEAVARILSGDRKWKRKKNGSINELIIMVIVSLIRIEAAKIADEDNQLFSEHEAGIAQKYKKTNYKKRRIIPLYYTDKEGKEYDTTIIDVENYKQHGLTKTENEFDFEKIDESEFIGKLETEFENDETAFFVFQEILDGNKSNIDISKKLGIEVRDVENARKRIKRKALNLKAK